MICFIYEIWEGEILNLQVGAAYSRDSLQMYFLRFWIRAASDAEIKGNAKGRGMNLIKYRKFKILVIDIKNVPSATDTMYIEKISKKIWLEKCY